MKRFFCAIIFVLTLPVAAQGFDPFFYVFGGLASSGEDADALVGVGIGWRVGFRASFLNYFGAEVLYDTTEAIGPIPALIDTNEREIEDNSSANTYLSFLGTCAYPLNDRIAVLRKVGFSRYTVDVDFLPKDINITTTKTRAIVLFDVSRLLERSFSKDHEQGSVEHPHTPNSKELS